MNENGPNFISSGNKKHSQREKKYDLINIFFILKSNRSEIISAAVTITVAGIGRHRRV